MSVKKLTMNAMFTTIALVIYTLEVLIPVPIPIPGIKLGLANMVTLFMLFAPNNKFYAYTDLSSEYGLKNSDAVGVLFRRIIIGSLIIGRPLVIIYGLAGGLLAIMSQIIMKRFVTVNQIWACGAVGAIIHNIGQIFVAVIIMGTPSIIVYLPALIITGAVTGTITGLITQYTVKYFMGIRKIERPQ